MIFRWWKQRRRQRVLAEPFPAAWRDFLRDNVWHYPLLSEEEQPRLEAIVQVLVAEKNWEGCGGLTLTDEIRVTVAGWAGLLLLNLQHDYYPRTPSILIYPSGYRAMEPIAGHIGFEPGEARLGEAWSGGAVVLAWDETLEDGREPGYNNLAIHEFAHQLDMLDREAQGTPPIDDTAAARTWQTVMAREYQRLVQAAERGRRTLLDPYGAENEAEFFAVASEAFFEMPLDLREMHPDLYRVLHGYYRQDVAERVAPLYEEEA